jgi:hypothetical protein
MIGFRRGLEQHSDRVEGLMKNSQRITAPAVGKRRGRYFEMWWRPLAADGGSGARAHSRGRRPWAL